MNGILHHHGSRTRFTQVANSAARDDDLSLKARGLLLLLLSHRDGWATSERQLAKECREGRDAIRTGLQELEDAGYLHREQGRDEGGTLGSAVWNVTDSPDSAPWLDYPSTAEPSTVDPTTKNTKGKKTEDQEHQQGDAEDRGDSLTPRFPTRPSAQNRYVDAVWGWMQGQNIKVDPRWPKAEKYKAALRVATDKLGVATTAGETAGIHLGCEYARDVRGDLHPAASKHMAALVGNYGPLVAFDAVVRAIDQGAGLDDEFADKPKALTHYALAIIRSDRNEAARV